MPVYFDQMNRAVQLPAVPKRIVSLVPSQTELLFDLGLDEEIIGITKFCIHPKESVKQKVKIGGTKTLNINLIKKLKPDLIIGNKEENERGQIEELMQHFPVWMSNISDLDGALDMIKKVGDITGKGIEAETLATKIEQQFNNITIRQCNLCVVYLIWRRPYMVAGKGTFIDDMLQRCGMINVFDGERYPEVADEALIVSSPHVALLSSEPYPFKDKHIAEFQKMLPGTIVKLVDGELFSWYGSRLLHAPEYFEKLISEIQSV